MSDEPDLARLMRRLRSLGRSGGGPWPRRGRRPWDEKPDLPGKSWDEVPEEPGRSWDEAPPP